MSDYSLIERQLTQHLGLEHRPIAVAFRDAPPPGVARFEGTVPSGCSFWRLAAEGKTFCTVPSDHYNCPVGSFTHNLPLPPERAHELAQVLEFMTGKGYLRMEEIPGVARLPSTPAAVIYSPLGDAPLDPDVVLFQGRPATMMLLQEAALRAGGGSEVKTLARPTCMAIPAALSERMVASTGCIGNRVYTGIADTEFYVAIAGGDVGSIAREAETIRAANATLMEYHRGRREALATE